MGWFYDKDTFVNKLGMGGEYINEDGSITSTTSFIDFNDFILDEGTWDD